MKTFRLLVVLVLLSPLMIRAEKEITLLLVPRADVPVKIGMDVGSRMPTLLLTYQVNPGGTISPSWLEWNSLGRHFRECLCSGQFFQQSTNFGRYCRSGGRQGAGRINSKCRMVSRGLSNQYA